MAGFKEKIPIGTSGNQGKAALISIVVILYVILTLAYFTVEFDKGYIMGLSYIRQNATFRLGRFMLHFNSSNSRGGMPMYDEENDTTSYASTQTDLWNLDESRHSRISVAIVGGITSAGIKTNFTKDVVCKKFPFFNVLIPSFCKTCSEGYDYHFYFAYDFTDRYFSNSEYLALFYEIFDEFVQRFCSSNGTYELHMVQCSHTKHPAWAQNDAAMDAYLDNMEYLYRVNDDTRMVTKGWTEIFIEKLASFDPPNVGTVGPHHSGGNTAILTYDFTHHTHQTIFGFHYPRDFTDWFADDWMTGVYKPGRVEKVKEVKLAHTMQYGQRYKHHSKLRYRLKERYETDKATIFRYVKHLNEDVNITKDTSKVIAMSVTSGDADVIWGALRNVQLANILFPEWTVTIYTNLSITSTSDHQRIFNKIKKLGGKVAYLNVDTVQYDLSLQALLYKNAHYVLVRNPLHRLDERQKYAVEEWIKSKKQFHCMRDYHFNRSTTIQTLYGLKLPNIYMDIDESVIQTLTDSKLLDMLRNSTLCHDSVSCIQMQNSELFPNSTRQMGPFIGQRYNAFMEPIDKIPPGYVYNQECIT